MPAFPAIWWMVRTTCSANGLQGVKAVGVTAGASAPELLVQQVVERLQSWGGEDAARDHRARGGNVVFSLPQVAATDGRARLNRMRQGLHRQHGVRYRRPPPSAAVRLPVSSVVNSAQA